jgi:hypothetical protein
MVQNCRYGSMKSLDWVHNQRPLGHQLNCCEGTEIDRLGKRGVGNCSNVILRAVQNWWVMMGQLMVADGRGFEHVLRVSDE